MRSQLRKNEGKNKHKYNNWLFARSGLSFFGVASLLWFIFRTGTKPSRIAYPCQRVALANSSMFLGISVPLSVVLVSRKAKVFLFKRRKALALLIIVVCAVISSEPFWGAFQTVGAVEPNQELYKS